MKSFNILKYENNDSLAYEEVKVESVSELVWNLWRGKLSFSPLGELFSTALAFQVGGIIFGPAAFASWADGHCIRPCRLEKYKSTGDSGVSAYNLRKSVKIWERMLVSLRLYSLNSRAVRSLRIRRPRRRSPTKFTFHLLRWYVSDLIYAALETAVQILRWSKREISWFCRSTWRAPTAFPVEKIWSVMVLPKNDVLC